MALRGSLLEFELPDIFQLIANDGKTGQLVIYDKDMEGFVIFSRGSIISAGNSVLNLQMILFKYIINIKHYAEQELNELLYLCQGEMKLFTQELMNKGYLSKDELTFLARMSIEDLACSLFFWENGRYRFDSLDNVEDYTAGGVTLSSDAVTMEAMRRLDEWKRMKNTVSDETVFMRLRSNDPAHEVQPSPPHSVMDPVGLISSSIDGVSSVALVCDRLFFTEYRVYETLFELWQTKRIAPLKTAPYGRKILPASKAPTKSSHIAGPIIVSIVVAHCIVLFLCGLGYMLNNALFYKMNRERRDAKNSLSVAYAETKIRIAALQFRSIVGSPPTNLAQLKDSGLILSRDVSKYPIAVQNDLEKNQDSLEKK
jgi:hypothetical protein